MLEGCPILPRESTRRGEKEDEIKKRKRGKIPSYFLLLEALVAVLYDSGLQVTKRSPTRLE